MRRHLVESALWFAEIEDKICRDHEDRASRQPDRAKEHQDVADRARAGAARAREIAREFSD
jgi:hypothetical protein